MKWKTYLFGYLIVWSCNSLLFAQIEFSGNVTGVSTYVWRGVKANNGPAMQGTGTITYKSFSLGLWSSSVNFGDDVESETDPFIEITLPTGDISTSIGATVYMYDFNKFNDNADFELELYGTLDYKSLGLSLFYVPEQKSTEGDANRSNYWIDISVSSPSLKIVDLSAVVGFGTYSSRWIPAGPKKDPVCLLLLRVGKSVTENFAVDWYYSIDINSGFENIYYISAGYNF